MTSFSSYAGTPAGPGYIQVSTDTNAVIAQLAGAAIQFTNDGGATWTNATSSPTTPAASYWAWAGSNYLAKDWVTASKYYFIQYDGLNTGTIEVSTNGGQTWAGAGATFASTGYLNVIKAVPGNAGDLFFSAGARFDLSGSAATIPALVAAHPATEPFYFSHDGGATKTAIAGFNEVISFGFTKAQSGGYPSIVLSGWGANGYGEYRCDNFSDTSPNAGTWTYLGVPLWADIPTDVSGDPNQWGRFSIAKQGSSVEIGQVTGQPNSWP